MHLGALLVSKKISGLVKKIEKTADTIDAEILQLFLRKEHPQTIALTLSLFSKDKSAKTLCLLPGALWTEVVMRIYQLSPVEYPFLEIIYSEICSIKASIPNAYRGTGPFKAIGLINSLSRENREMMLDSIEERDPDMREALENTTSIE